MDFVVCPVSGMIFDLAFVKKHLTQDSIYMNGREDVINQWSFRNPFNGAVIWRGVKAVTIDDSGEKSYGEILDDKEISSSKQVSITTE